MNKQKCAKKYFTDSGMKDTTWQSLVVHSNCPRSSCSHLPITGQLICSSALPANSLSLTYCFRLVRKTRNCGTCGIGTLSIWPSLIGIVGILSSPSRYHQNSKHRKKSLKKYLRSLTLPRSTRQSSAELKINAGFSNLKSRILIEILTFYYKSEKNNDVWWHPERFS